MNDWQEFLAEIRAHAGGPRPCSLCGEPTPPEQLTECWVPGYVIAEWDIPLQRVAYVCPRCPVMPKDTG